MGKSFSIHNLGCKVNIYEGEAVCGMLREKGFIQKEFDEASDICIINTCTVTSIADKKSRQMIRRAKELNPDALVVAMGCFVNTADNAVLDGLPIDIALGNNEKSKLPGLIEEFFENRERKTGISDISKKGTPFEYLNLPDSLNHTRAFVKIQDGCDRFCSYCIIPYARGRARSKRDEAVMAEVRSIAANGYKEVDISGICLSDYGKDTGGSLIEILEAIQGIDGIERIRLGSMEQGIITEEFVKRLKDCDKVCPHFHLSLQSGSDSVLKRMNRHYDTAAYEEKCNILRAYYDHPAITTDVIAGFPGETAAEHEQTMTFVKRIGFYQMHVFPYSIRKGTPAASMKPQLTTAQKKNRAGELIKLSAEMSHEFEAFYEGKEIRVLVETLENGRYSGHSDEYIHVTLDSATDITGQLVKVTYRLN